MQFMYTIHELRTHAWREKIAPVNWEKTFAKKNSIKAWSHVTGESPNAMQRRYFDVTRVAFRSLTTACVTSLLISWMFFSQDDVGDCEILLMFLVTVNLTHVHMLRDLICSIEKCYMLVFQISCRQNYNREIYRCRVQCPVLVSQGSLVSLLILGCASPWRRSWLQPARLTVVKVIYYGVDQYLWSITCDFPTEPG